MQKFPIKREEEIAKEKKKAHKERKKARKQKGKKTIRSKNKTNNAESTALMQSIKTKQTVR